MCGIVGYIGNREAQDVLLKSLSRLEYRGYDSAGVAIHDGKSIEIVRTLSDYFSLCTVLELADPSRPVRKGDEILSHLWHKNKFLTIALHGTFDPPKQAYSKERLTALLKEAGCRVVDKLQPGTDLVITGDPKGLAEDVWFKTARSDILVDMIGHRMRLYYRINPAIVHSAVLRDGEIMQIISVGEHQWMFVVPKEAKPGKEQSQIRIIIEVPPEAPPGFYQVIRQREYFPGAIRPVSD